MEVPVEGGAASSHSGPNEGETDKEERPPLACSSSICPCWHHAEGAAADTIIHWQRIERLWSSNIDWIWAAPQEPSSPSGPAWHWCGVWLHGLSICWVFSLTKMRQPSSDCVLSQPNTSSYGNLPSAGCNIKCLYLHHLSMELNK